MAWKSFAEDDFERKWKALTPQKRKQLVLDGIHRAMLIPDMSTKRKFCPDTTWEYLISRGGDGFLRMLKALIPADIKNPIPAPILVPHPGVEVVLSLSPEQESMPGYRTMMRDHRIHRAECLTNIIRHIYLGFVCTVLPIPVPPFVSLALEYSTDTTDLPSCATSSLVIPARQMRAPSPRSALKTNGKSVARWSRISRWERG